MSKLKQVEKRMSWLNKRSTEFEKLRNASINSSGAHAPGQPRGIFAICSRCQPGGGAFANFIAARGLGVAQGDPRAFHTCFQKMDEFTGKDEAFIKAKASRRRKAISALTCVLSIT